MVDQHVGHRWVLEVEEADVNEGISELLDESGVRGRGREEGIVQNRDARKVVREGHCSLFQQKKAALSGIFGGASPTDGTTTPASSKRPPTTGSGNVAVMHG